MSNGSAGAGSAMATRALEGVSGRLWNLRAHLMADIVDQHGPAQSLKWFASNMPTYEKILKTWGPLRTHYLAVAVSSINGCAYCTYGHAYAFVLHYFDRTGNLFPLDEHEMRDLRDLDDGRIAAQLAMALREAGMSEEVPWLERTLALHADMRRGDVPESDDRDDRWLCHLIEMFGWLNACGINAGTEPDEAHDPINKNRDVRHRYAAARRAAV